MTRQARCEWISTISENVPSHMVDRLSVWYTRIVFRYVRAEYPTRGTADGRHESDGVDGPHGRDASTCVQRPCSSPSNGTIIIFRLLFLLNYGFTFHNLPGRGDESRTRRASADGRNDSPTAAERWLSKRRPTYDGRPNESRTTNDGRRTPAYDAIKHIAPLYIRC